MRCSFWGLIGPGVFTLAMALAPGLARANPNAPRLFCETYPENPQCSGGLITCETCHTSTDPAAWNAYGGQLLAELGDTQLEVGLPDALLAVEDIDSDGDGATNLDEILVGTNPGNPDSLWTPIPEPSGQNPFYDVGNYDVTVAYRRAMTLYCGQSPDYESMQLIRDLGDEDASNMLHEDLAACLDGEYWRTTGLRELADERVKPIKAVGADTQVVISDFLVVLADYEWDYRLWRFILSEDRDMRLLLTADYHVQEMFDGTLVKVEGAIPDPLFESKLAGGQPLQPEHRAGMITTQWFLMSNTMFSALPRTTAAQAYRAFLGMDISANEGIWPVPGEPVDVDNKGVQAPACAQCHSTLDPLSYAFAYYEGIVLPFGNGVYDPGRPASLIPDWDDQQTVLLGETVGSVPQWGQMASQTPEFRKTMASMLFEHAMGRPAWPDEHAQLQMLANSMLDDGHSANRLIHRLVDTAAFATP